MYISKLGCGCGCGGDCGGTPKGMAGLRGDSSANATSTATTQTAVSTQVSPNISPNFIQQQQPTNSGVNASTTQTLPGMPGSTPGIDSGFSPYTLPTPVVQPAQTSMNNLLIYGALGAVVVAIVMKKRKQKTGKTTKASA